MTTLTNLFAACAASFIASTVSAQETFARYHFVNDSLRSTDGNSDVSAGDMTSNRSPFFWEGNGFTNICIGQAFSGGGYIQFTVEPSNSGEALNLSELFFDYGGHGGNGDVDRMRVFADEDPGSGGDNFQTVLYETSNLEVDRSVDLSGVGFLQNVSGEVAIRIHFVDTQSNGGDNSEWDQIRLTGSRVTGPVNECIGPQLFFDEGWQNSSYTVNGQTPEWYFPDWNNNFDVACIGDPDPGVSTHIPAIWSNSCSVGCRRLEFTIKGRSEGHDDDTIGFVLGFCDGDQNDPNADYLAVLWNGPSQTGQFDNHCSSITKPEGLRLVRVTGIPDPAEFLGQTNLDCTPEGSGVEVLQEAINLANTGWPLGVEQDVRVEVTETGVRVWIEGTLEIDFQSPIMPIYLERCFGYFAQSQFSDFWGLEIESLNPFDAAWSNYGAGTPGCAGVPEISMLERPVLGTTGRVFLGNDQAVETTCTLFVSLAQDTIFLPILGGDLLIGLPTAGNVTFAVPPGGTTFDCAVPDNSCVGGISLYWQAICLDDCNLLSATAGLEMTFGDF